MDNAIQTVVGRRFAYRVGDWLPKPLKIVYYIILIISLIYILYRFIEWVLVTTQKVGEFIFRPQNYWASVIAMFTVLIGVFIAAQFFLGLDPLGYTWRKILELLSLLETRFL